MVRDVVLRRIPAIFGGNTLYATCALAASGVVVLEAYTWPVAGAWARYPRPRWRRRGRNR